MICCVMEMKAVFSSVNEVVIVFSVKLQEFSVRMMVRLKFVVYINYFIGDVVHMM